LPSYRRPPKLLRTEQATFNNVRARILHLQFPWNTPKCVIGVDPGQVNAGVALVQGKQGILYQIKFPSDRNAVNRIQVAREFLHDLFSLLPSAALTCVEYAAFGKAFGQVPLAEMRTCAVIAAYERGGAVCLIPPATIRKEVFGSGKTKAHDVWTNLPHDAAAALSCALFAAHRLGE
jgi:Holliday junction resolvasome RuvABC endonuclease subunit